MEESSRKARRRARDESAQELTRRPGQSVETPPVRRLRTTEPSGAQGGVPQQENRLLVRSTKQASFQPKIELYSNYFELLGLKKFHLYQYHVDYTPEIEHAIVCNALLRQHEAMLGKYVFDGKMLFCVTRLARDPMEFISRRNDGTEIKIKIRLSSEVSVHDSGYNQVLNIIVRRCLHMLDLVMIKRNYYDHHAAIHMHNHSLTIWPGYMTTIRPHDGGYLLNVEIRHKVLRSDTAYNVMDKIRRESPRDSFDKNVKSELLGKIVMTKYNNKTYRVDDVVFDMTPMSTFHLRREDRDITYAEYYQTRYKATIINMTQPLLLSRPSRRDKNRGDDQPIYLIPELCGMTDLSGSQLNNMALRKDMANAMRLDAANRVQSLLRFRSRLTNNTAIQQELSKWGIQLSENFVRCHGHVPVNNLKIVLGSQEVVPQRSGWSESMKRGPLAAHPPQLPIKWAFIYPESNGNQVKSFMRTIKEVSDGLQLRLARPDEYAVPNDRINGYTQLIDEVCRKFEYHILVVFLKTKRADMYQAIKMKTLCEYGVPSQVVTLRIISGDDSKTKSVATKLMIQISAKLGGQPWRVNAPIPEEPWMVIGYDAYHDKYQKRSVGAFVATVNSTWTKHFSKASRHSDNEEISPTFEEDTLRALRAYAMENNRTLPGKIIVYRDGIGQGDLERIIEIEAKAVESAVERAKMKLGCPEKQIGIAYVIVSKKTNTRFFRQESRGLWTNPSFGTVVDNVVTLPERFEFFLVSQNTNQGTVSPTSYNVAYNTANLSPDDHQRLAYYLTHLYFNWAGTLKIPAPVQYAHKLAYLCGESLASSGHGPRQELELCPYYL